MEIPEWIIAVAEMENLRATFVHTIWLVGSGQRSNLRPTAELAKRYLTEDGRLTTLGQELYRTADVTRMAYTDRQQERLDQRAHRAA